MRQTCMILSIVAIMSICSACSVYKAATQPGPADLAGLGVGSQRTEVIARLGAPKFSDTDQTGQKQDTFEFQSGFHQASKVRIIPYLAADLFTLTLAEIILWPMELTVLDRATCLAVVTYDPSHHVKTWVVTKKDGVQGC